MKLDNKIIVGTWVILEMHCRKYIYSGDVLEIEEYVAIRKPGTQISRGKNEHLTTEQQREQNLRNARKKLSRLINTNFGKGDLFLTLTYAGAQPDDEQARRDLKNYIRRLRDHRRKAKLPDLKYIAVTEGSRETSDHRVHHHVILSGMSIDEAAEIWEAGRAIGSRLEPGGDYTGLAHYITKEPPRGEHKKRWSQSRNLKKPRVVRKIITSHHNRPIRVSKKYKVIVQELYASERTGRMQYIKAIRIGGMDYAAGKGSG